MKPEPLVLVVDDDLDIANMLARALERHGFKIEAITSPEEALRRAQTTHYDAALVDLVMPERDGVALATSLRERIPGLPVAILTGYAHSPLISEARRAGAFVFKKPTPIQDLVAYLESEIPRDRRQPPRSETEDAQG
jgi:DNA-binding NtrC family response regulator